MNRFMLPEEDFGKILAKTSLSTGKRTRTGIDNEGLKLILGALYGIKSIQEASSTQHKCLIYLNISAIRFLCGTTTIPILLNG